VVSQAAVAEGGYLPVAVPGIQLPRLGQMAACIGAEPGHFLLAGRGFYRFQQQLAYSALASFRHHEYARDLTDPRRKQAQTRTADDSAAVVGDEQQPAWRAQILAGLCALPLPMRLPPYLVSGNSPSLTRQR
jgi:hypothetical protein